MKEWKKYEKYWGWRERRDLPEEGTPEWERMIKQNEEQLLVRNASAKVKEKVAELSRKEKELLDAVIMLHHQGETLALVALANTLIKEKYQDQIDAVYRGGKQYAITHRQRNVKIMMAAADTLVNFDDGDDEEPYFCLLENEDWAAMQQNLLANLNSDHGIKISRNTLLRLLEENRKTIERLAEIKAKNWSEKYIGSH